MHGNSSHRRTREASSRKRGVSLSGSKMVLLSAKGSRGSPVCRARTSQSSALDVRLCGNPGCTNGILNLGSIKSFSGYQQYRLDDEAAPFSHVVIWCRAVSLPFGYGELS